MSELTGFPKNADGRVLLPVPAHSHHDPPGEGLRSSPPTGTVSRRRRFAIWWHMMPHELAFGAFILLTMLRFACARGCFSPLVLVYGGMLLVIFGAVGWCRQRESDLRWRVRLGIYPVLVNSCYFTLGIAAAAFHPRKEDAFLQSLDAHLTDRNASLMMEPLSHPVLTELFSICYFAFFPALLFAWIHYFRRELPVLRRFITGMFTMYAIAFLGYCLLPALGPHLDPALASQFHGPLAGGWMTKLNSELVLDRSNRVDAFPSLHCGLTAFILLFDRAHAPHRFRTWLLPVVGLWIATVYLRYHYLVDVLAGFAIAVAVFAMVRQPQFAKARKRLRLLGPSPLGVPAPATVSVLQHPNA